MIFQHTLSQVLSQIKTQTRRIVGDKETAIRGAHNQILAIQINGRDKWRVGKSYAVQAARGHRQTARIQLLKIRSEKLSRISRADACAEGFSSRQAFLNTWDQIHGPNNRDTRVWVLEFELGAVVLQPNILMHNSTAYTASK